MRDDGSLELGERGLAGRCLADVGRRQLQFVERMVWMTGSGMTVILLKRESRTGGGLRWMKVKAAATLPAPGPSTLWAGPLPPGVGRRGDE